jgi:hypothetical protein
MKERKKNTGWKNDTEIEKLKLATVGLHTVTKWKESAPRLPVLQRKIHTRTHPIAVQRNRETEMKE